jgi:hemerythrin
MKFGLPLIDEEHEHLVSLINRLYAAVQEGNNPTAVQSVFDEVKSYADFHFGHEVILFTPTDYPHKALHIREHAELAQRIVALEEVVRIHDMEKAGSELMHFLLDWLIKHTQDTDAKYVPYLINNPDLFKKTE